MRMCTAVENFNVYFEIFETMWEFWVTADDELWGIWMQRRLGSDTAGFGDCTGGK